MEPNIDIDSKQIEKILNSIPKPTETDMRYALVNSFYFLKIIYEKGITSTEKEWAYKCAQELVYAMGMPEWEGIPAIKPDQHKPIIDQ